LDDRVVPTSSIAEAVAADAVLVAVPAQQSRAVATLAMGVRAGTPVVACAKGIERGTRKFMTEVIAECLPQAVPAILSGPGFAEDVARGLPTAVTLAAQDETVAARAETLTGLSGLGDLILTCLSPQSRNFSLGLALGQGRTVEQAHRDGRLAEGMFTASVLVEMANERGVEMPIASAVAAMLDGRMSVDAAIESLLTRPLRAEV
jgi:glycerol-3-phosphate dehydrogenase